MVEFWTDHFNVPILTQKRYLHYVRTVYDREIIREHALGNFGELLHAVARSAAMLKYLDGYRNTAGGVNENFARELLELMTLGADGGYDESDIQQLSLAFTGWQYFPLNHPQYGEFYFDPGRHVSGPKQILGLQIPSGGENEASAVLDFLATHPIVAERITRKLGSWLLGYEPRPSAVAAGRQAFLNTGGDITQVLRALLTPRNLIKNGAFSDRKLKRPLHYAASLIRATGATFTSLNGVRETFDSLGQVSFDWAPPNGYPDSPQAWIWLQYPRLQYASDLAQDSLPWLQFGTAQLLEVSQGAPRSLWARAVLGRLTADSASLQEVNDLQQYVDNHAHLSDQELLRELVVLAAMAPGFQEY